MSNRRIQLLVRLTVLICLDGAMLGYASSAAYDAVSVAHAYQLELARAVQKLSFQFFASNMTRSVFLSRLENPGEVALPVTCFGWVRFCRPRSLAGSVISTAGFESNLPTPVNVISSTA